MFEGLMFRSKLLGSMNLEDSHATPADRDGPSAEVPRESGDPPFEIARDGRDPC